MRKKITHLLVFIYHCLYWEMMEFKNDRYNNFYSSDVSARNIPCTLLCRKQLRTCISVDIIRKNIHKRRLVAVIYDSESVTGKLFT